MKLPSTDPVYTVCTDVLIDVLRALRLWTVLFSNDLENEALRKPFERVATKYVIDKDYDGTVSRRHAHIWPRKPYPRRFKTTAWMRNIVKHLSCGNFREEELWKASFARLKKLDIAFASNHVKFTAQRLIHLHHTDAIPENIPQPLYAYLLEGEGQIGRITLLVLSRNVNELVNIIWEYGAKQAGDMQAVHGNTAQLESTFVQNLAESAAYEEVSAEASDAVLRKLATELSQKAKISNDAASDNATHIMSIDPRGSLTENKLLSLKKSSASVIQIIDQNDRIQAATTNTDVDHWFALQESSSKVPTSQSAYERYMRDPVARKAVSEFL